METAQADLPSQVSFRARGWHHFYVSAGNSHVCRQLPVAVGEHLCLPHVHLEAVFCSFCLKIMNHVRYVRFAESDEQHVVREAQISKWVAWGVNDHAVVMPGP
eukprot:8008302-Pyramimonas_sp.AAC.1